MWEELGDNCCNGERENYYNWGERTIVLRRERTMVLGERTMVLGGERTLGRENNSTGWSEIEHWYWERTIVLGRENYSTGEGENYGTGKKHKIILLGKERDQ